MTRIVLDLPNFYNIGPQGEPHMLREWADRVADGYVTGSTGRDTMSKILRGVAEQLENPRPLIVLESPEGGSDFDHFPRLVAYLRRGGWDVTADQIEVQTKPARIPEPGLYGVVKSGSAEWTRLRSRTSFNDWISDTGTRGQWSEIPNPTLIREGVTS